jgi:hypothetical protein
LAAPMPFAWAALAPRSPCFPIKLRLHAASYSTLRPPR